MNRDLLDDMDDSTLLTLLARNLECARELQQELHAYARDPLEPRHAGRGVSVRSSRS